MTAGHHIEAWFGLTSREPRASGLRAHVRFDGAAELHDATFGFQHGWAKFGEMTHCRVWLRAPELALDGVLPTRGFDVLQDGQVIARGEVLTRG
ncbi:MAG: hypothetical protein JWN44_5116 [Myxococcales bacterium]|nr:hypothetical protein [Myxococcales bacterium]